MFETERLRLRAQEKDDVDKLRKLWNEREVQRTLSFDRVIPLGPDFDEKLANWAKEALIHFVIEKRSGNEFEFMGFINLFGWKKKNRDCMLGLAILPKFWGQGYATEALRFLIDYAFTELALHRVTLGVFGSNAGAIKVYKKVGFVQEGVSRKSNWIGGKWEDELHMGILEEDWAAARQASEA